MSAAKNDFRNEQKISLRRPPNANATKLARRYEMLSDDMTVGDALRRFTIAGWQRTGRRQAIRDLIRLGCISVS